MFNLLTQDIHLAATAQNKESAIKQVAAALTEAGYVKDGYVQGMLNRENQAPTYLGNGIAIPHGTTDTRDQVLKTGVAVFQFPAGVNWGDDQTAYIVIGIAAQSNEHLSLLRQLTKVLSDEAIAAEMAKTDSAETLRSLLMGEKTSQALAFSLQTLSLGMDAHSLNVLQAMNIARLQQTGAIANEFITHALTHQPLHLGQGIWLSDSPVGNLGSAIAIATPQEIFSTQDEHAVAMLVTVAMADNQPEAVLNNLSQILLQQHAANMLKITDAETLVNLLNNENSGEQQPESGLSEEFVIRNAHGLHTRPSTMLVSTIKKFDSAVTVTNLDGSGVPVNGRSLMKVVSLGVKKGHRLRINVEGPDAQVALETIGNAIREGLGEEVA